MQDWRKAGLEGCRTGGRQDWRKAGLERNNSIKLMMTSLPVIMYDVNSSEPDVKVYEIAELNLK